MSNELEHSELLLSNQLCFRLYTASRLIIKSYTPLLTKLGLTYPQYLVMMALWEHDRQPVGHVSRRLLLGTNTLTPMLKRMESMGLITRSRTEGDRRMTIVELTELGRKMEDEAAQIPHTQVERLVCNGAADELIPGINIRLDSLISVLKSLTDDEEPKKSDKA